MTTTVVEREKSSLLDYLVVRSSCSYLSDLRYLDREQRAKAAVALESLPVNTWSLGEWNTALAYLDQPEEKNSPASARRKLLDALRVPRLRLPIA